MKFLNKPLNELKFDFSDFTIIPARTTSINSRSEVSITEMYDHLLPIFVAPMDTVIDNSNVDKFTRHGLSVTYPRVQEGEVTYSIDLIHTSANFFVSVSLNEFIEMEKANLTNNMCKCILVDIANGHMEKLVEAVKAFKKKYPNSLVMVGNIANPLTYEALAIAGADYVRVGIGGGSACTTSANTAVHYPVASLIAECYKIKKGLNFKTQIVADGGFKNFDDIIKAIALGANYVMLGSLFNKTFEACGQAYLFKKIKVSNRTAYKLAKMHPVFKRNIYRKYRGMSTKEVQKTWNKGKLKTSEGIVKFNKVEYTVEQWVENFSHYLRSAMSYCDCKTLQEFRENAQGVFMTNNSHFRYHK